MTRGQDSGAAGQNKKVHVTDTALGLLTRLPANCLLRFSARAQAYFNSLPITAIPIIFVLPLPAPALSLDAPLTWHLHPPHRQKCPPCSPPINRLLLPRRGFMSVSKTSPGWSLPVSDEFSTLNLLMDSRFILNLPEVELASLERVCFQVEQA